MTKIETDGYVFLVDIENTVKYYSENGLCECPNCRNLYPQIKDAFPLLDEFLTEFGVDIEKPDNIESYDSDDEKSIDYTSTDYTVCGKIEVMGEYEIDIKDSQFLSVTVIDGFASPNFHKDDDYFTLCVNFFKLPWVLDEEFPKFVPTPIDNEFSSNVSSQISVISKIKSLFSRLFNL